MRCCDGKIRYLTQSAAEVAVGAINTNKRKPQSPKRPLCAYTCPGCTFWHIGHSRRSAS